MNGKYFLGTDTALFEFNDRPRAPCEGRATGSLSAGIVGSYKFQSTRAL